MGNFSTENSKLKSDERLGREKTRSYSKKN